jgi:hypothetical protein
MTGARPKTNKAMKVRNLIHIVAFIPLIVLTGCASIVSKSNWPVSIKSDPPGAEVTISDESGREIHQGVTPMTVKLKSDGGFFVPGDYLINVRLAGYGNDRGVIKAGLNPWYFGNIIFGGVIGLVVVDPATGAMWKLPGEYNVHLSTAVSASSSTTNTNTSLQK